MLLTFILKTQFILTVDDDGLEAIALNTNTLEGFSPENIIVNEYDEKSR